MTTKNATAASAFNYETAILVMWNNNWVSLIDRDGIHAFEGKKGDVLVREARKLAPVPSYPVNSRGEESSELEWLPGCGAFYLGAECDQEVTMLLEYLDHANFM